MGREMNEIDKRLSQVLEDTIARIAKLVTEKEHHESFIASAQETCDHIWVGQDDVHPHGTPRETFICAVCKAEKVR